MTTAKLATQKCEACKADSPHVTHDEVIELLRDLPGWQVVKDDDDVHKLRKVFVFKNFRLALDFTNLVGELAEEQQHHPTIVTEWGRVTVVWWTHKIRGLHKNDFILAARCEEAARQIPKKVEK
jgi:4a-hydroxytetrahydrobiopterin dehydratase